MHDNLKRNILPNAEKPSETEQLQTPAQHQQKRTHNIVVQKDRHTERHTERHPKKEGQKLTL